MNHLLHLPDEAGCSEASRFLITKIWRAQTWPSYCSGITLWGQEKQASLSHFRIGSKWCRLCRNTQMDSQLKKQ